MRSFFSLTASAVVERLAEDPWLVLHHPIPDDADPQLLKAARAAAVVCRFASEDLVTHWPEDPHASDIRKIDGILADINNRLGEPEPEPIPLDPEMEATLEKLEKDWQAPPRKPRERER